MNENYNPNEQVLQYKDHSGFFAMYDKQKQIILTLLADAQFKECRKAIKILIAHTATYIRDPKSYLERLNKDMNETEIITIYSEITKEHSLNELQPKLKVELEEPEDVKFWKEETNKAMREVKKAFMDVIKG
jgi:hypothetical protein